ncbi:hypothetical protein KY349_01815 [Candidatus Woesearchaeota archaeon]|nr:hypothetical protein [Candidatus Woesearchaeota archaeon]
MRDVVYQVESDSLKEKEVEGCCRIDLHVHSKYSGVNPTNFVDTPVTKTIGVREGYTSLRTLYKRLKKRGMDMFTVSDHDSINGAILMRDKHPKKSFISCEYTVKAHPEEEQFIHVNCVGIDFAGGATKPLPDIIVYALHAELMYHARLGYEEFIEFCRNEDISHVLCHPPWAEKMPLTGKLLDRLTDEFDVLEINGDAQLENLVTAEIAMQKGKTLCAGTDAHTSIRLGDHYTSTIYPVSTPYDFIKAFKEKDIAIGTNVSIPASISEERAWEDIIRYGFSGTVAGLRKDVYRGVRSYLLLDWGARKLVTLGTLLGLPFFLSMLAGPEIGIPPFAALEALAVASIPYVMTRAERKNVADKTRELYKDYHQHLFLKETEDKRAEIAKITQEVDNVKQDHERRKLPKIIKEPKGWDWLVYKLLKPFKVFHR